MKKYIKTLLILLFGVIALNTCSTKAASLKLKYNNKTVNYKKKQISCQVDGKNIKMNSTKGIILNNTIMMSYKDIIKSGLKIDCEYDSGEGSLTISGNGKTIVMNVGSKTAYVNDKKTKLTQAPVNVRYVKKKKTKLLIPVKKVAKTLGYTYSYNKSSSIVNLTSPFVINYNDEWHIYKKYKGTVVFNGNNVNLNEMPLLSIGCTMAPIKAVFQDAAGITYNYNEADGSILLESAQHKLTMYLNNTTAILDDNIAIELKKTPMIVTRKDTGYSCIMAPIATISSVFELGYKWNSSSHVSTITRVNYLNLTAQQGYFDNAVYTNGLTGINAVYDTSINNLVFTFTYTNAIDSNNIIVTQDDTSKLLAVNMLSTCDLIGNGSSIINSYKIYSIDYMQGSDNNTAILFHYSGNIEYYYSIAGNELKLIFAKQIDNNNSAISIPMPPSVTYNTITYDDRYYNNEFDIIIPGDQTKFFTDNIITVASSLITSYNTTYDPANNNTVITFTTNSTGILGFKLYQNNNSIGIMLGKPEEIYDNIVILDPGHGGKDPGAIENKTNECDINLSILYNKAKKYFNSAESPIKAYWTRTDNTFITLADRAAFASKMKAELFVSLHMNSSTTSAKGTEVYYCSTNNSANDFGLTSKSMATSMLNNIVAAVGTSKREVKAANYYVLRHNTVPAVLIELGFMTNMVDFSTITNAAKQDAAAKAIYDTLYNIYYK
jgi:N-acetylmuramoyl-L-alanine amidase